MCSGWVVAFFWGLQACKSAILLIFYKLDKSPVYLFNSFQNGSWLRRIIKSHTPLTKEKHNHKTMCVNGGKIMKYDYVIVGGGSAGSVLAASYD